MGRTPAHIVEARNDRIVALYTETSGALSTKQMAEKLGCSPSQVTRGLIARGIRRGAKYGGGRVSNKPTPTPTPTPEPAPETPPPLAPENGEPQLDAQLAKADLEGAFAQWQEQGDGSPEDCDGDALRLAFEAGWGARGAAPDPATMAADAARYLHSEARSAAADGNAAGALAHYTKLLPTLDRVSRYRPPEEQTGRRIDESHIAEASHSGLMRLTSLGTRLAAAEAEKTQQLLEFDPPPTMMAREAIRHTLRELGRLPTETSDD